MEKEQKHIIIKKLLYGVFLGILLLSTSQFYFSLIEESPLKGDVKEVYAPVFTSKNWYNGIFQDSINDYLKYNFGFRNSSVRLNNQIAYDLFKEVKANGVVVGKEEYLYEKNYIKAYLGLDFVGEEEIQDKINKLAYIQKKLSKKGKKLIVAFAPGKGTFYPEFIPEEYDTVTKRTSNYEVYKRLLGKTEIDVIDFNKWFVEQKEISDYPLYPKAGIHWSKYGEFLAADSIVRFIEKIRGNEMSHLVLDSVITKEKNEKTDYDIGNGMNLMFRTPTFSMGYPKYHIEPSTSSKGSKTLFVSDSFFWGMFNSGFSKKLFGGGKFWYYAKSIYPDSFKKPTLVSKKNIIQRMEAHDNVIILCTDANLYKFAFKFIDKAYSAYKSGIKSEPKAEESYKERLRRGFRNIRETPHWLEKVKKQAIEKGISLEQCIEDNAKYIIWQEDQKK
mgnify:CR=1 FL=1|tara:strand:+ start:215 stop:1549 length:1335 start_codon:yes stop_codon:yes gene_type:complete